MKLVTATDLPQLFVYKKIRKRRRFCEFQHFFEPCDPKSRKSTLVNCVIPSFSKYISFRNSVSFFHDVNLKKNFMAPFYGWDSTASTLQPLRGGSLLFTIQFPEIPGAHFIDLGRMKG